MKTKSRVVCALLAAVATGCGLPLPTDGAIECGPKVYLEVGVDPRFTCAEALSAVRNAAQETGVDLEGMRVVEFMRGDNLAELGNPNALGQTGDNDIAVLASYSNALIHELLHLDDHSHCMWAAKYLPLFERNYVDGAFTDDCLHVRCSSTHGWTDSVGQHFGNNYVCTPLDK